MSYCEDYSDPFERDEEDDDELCLGCRFDGGLDFDGYCVDCGDRARRR